MDIDAGPVRNLAMSEIPESGGCLVSLKLPHQMFVTSHNVRQTATDFAKTFKAGFAVELFGSIRKYLVVIPKILIGLESNMSCFKEFCKCFGFICCIYVHCTVVIWSAGRNSLAQIPFWIGKVWKNNLHLRGVLSASLFTLKLWQGSDGGREVLMVTAKRFQHQYYTSRCFIRFLKIYKQHCSGAFKYSFSWAFCPWFKTLVEAMLWSSLLLLGRRSRAATVKCAERCSQSKMENMCCNYMAVPKVMGSWGYPQLSSISNNGIFPENPEIKHPSTGASPMTMGTPPVIVVDFRWRESRVILSCVSGHLTCWPVGFITNGAMHSLVQTNLWLVALVFALMFAIDISWDVHSIVEKSISLSQKFSESISPLLSDICLHHCVRCLDMCRILVDIQ